MFKNCGATIKKIGKTFFYLCIGLAIAIVALDLADMEHYLLGSFEAVFILCLVLVITGIVVSPIIYGFGEIVECVKDIRDQGK